MEKHINETDRMVSNGRERSGTGGMAWHCNGKAWIDGNWLSSYGMETG